MKEITLFFTRMHALTIEETLQIILNRIDAGLFTQHVVINTAKLVHMQKDHKLKESVESCDLINIDGMGVVWAGRALGFHIPERVAGIDLFFSLLSQAQARNEGVYLLGATDNTIRKATEKIRKLYPHLNICGYHHGYFWEYEEEIVREICCSGATYLFVGITSPKKENFINRWKNHLNVQFAMGVGGSFDVVAGEAKRAPLWMQKSGMEWLYRVYQEPRRLFGRYFSTNFIFLCMLTRAVLSHIVFSSWCKGRSLDKSSQP